MALCFTGLSHALNVGLSLHGYFCSRRSVVVEAQHHAAARHLPAWCRLDAGGEAAVADPTAHAEILAMRRAAAAKNSSRLDDCDLYITLEPCAMCAAAISLARVRNVFYACADEKFGAVENGVKFFAAKSCYHKPGVYSGIAEIEAKSLLQEFFRGKRV